MRGWFFPASATTIGTVLDRTGAVLRDPLDLPFRAPGERRMMPLSQKAHPSQLGRDFTPIYHQPDSRFYVEGSGLLRLPDGDWLAAVPVVPRAPWKELRATHSRIHLMRSGDDGQTWREISSLPYYSAVLWLEAGSLYLFANKGGTTFRNDDLLLLRSLDGGQTWSDPVTLLTGHFWNCQTAMVRRENRLYWAIDDLSPGAHDRGPFVVIGDLARDPMDPAAWQRSNTVPFPGYPEALIARHYRESPEHQPPVRQYLEPNVIETADGIRVLCTVKLLSQSAAGLCAVLDLDECADPPTLAFNQYSAMPGGQLKFCIAHDPVSALYWAAVNLPADSQESLTCWAEGRTRGTFRGGGGNDRRWLMLTYSLDALNWFPAACLAWTPNLSQAFMYPHLVIDGDDLALIVRTCLYAPDQHDGDYATFHRIRNFRSLALPLRPQPDQPTP